MSRAHFVTSAAVLALLVTATVWPVRSRYLFSWDSANYAFAISRIDIARHRPHPPGYLGYVFAGRGLNTLTQDPNAALVAWNVLALATAGVCTVRLAAAAGASAGGAFAAAFLVITSPLVWFYATVAEIYVSELLWAVAVACAAQAALRGSDRALHWGAGALSGAAIFKVSTAVLMLPVAGYAWHRARPGARARSVLTLAVFAAIVTAVFLYVQPGWPKLVWQQFTSATNGSRLFGGNAAGRLGVALNRNARDTLTAVVAALGLVNACGLLWWLAADRSLPSRLGWRFAGLWAAPWLLEFLLVLIAKPGYLLPLVPLLSIVLADFYARRGRRVLLAIMAAQTVANLAYVVLLAPPVTSANLVRYRDKPFLGRLASDLQPLTFPTLATLAASDRHVAVLLALTRRVCPSGEWVVVAGTDPIDWRRAMYYLPSADAIHVLPDGSPVFVGRNGDFVDVTASGISIRSDCGLLWIGETVPPPAGQAKGQPVPDVGWLLPPGSGQVTREQVIWNPS